MRGVGLQVDWQMEQRQAQGNDCFNKETFKKTKKLRAVLRLRLSSD